MFPKAGCSSHRSALDQTWTASLVRLCSLQRSSVQSVAGLFFVVVVCVLKATEVRHGPLFVFVRLSRSLSHSFSASLSLFIMKRSDSSSVLSPLCNYPFAASVCVRAPLKRAHFSSPFKLYFIVDASGLCLFIRRVIGERNK